MSPKQIQPNPLRNIPAGVKRLVRQRCGFGCIFCGNPIIQYDHMTPFAEVREHVADNITLLCGVCHQDKTAGRKSEMQVRRANDRPYSLRGGGIKPYVWEPSVVDPMMTFVLGSNLVQYPECVIAIMVDDIEILKMSRAPNGLVTVDADFHNVHDQRVLVIRENELILSPASWDITFEGTRLAIRSALGVYILELDYQHDRVELTRAHLNYNGATVRVGSHWTKVSTRKTPDGHHGQFAGSLFRYPIAFALGDCTSVAAGPGSLVAAVRME